MLIKDSARSYWRIVLTAVGFLAAGFTGYLLHAPDSQRIPKYHEAQTIQAEQASGPAAEEPAATTAASVRIVETPEEAIASQAREADQRRHDANDLEAQIRAARAAEQQVPLTRLAVILSFAGTALIIWTLLETRKSAETATKTLEHAKRVSDAELRPWLALSIAPKAVSQTKNVVHLEFDVIYENVGKTIAKDFIARFEFVFAEGDPAEQIQFWLDKWEKERKPQRSVAMPGERYVFPGYFSQAHDTMPWRDLKDGRRFIMPMVIVCAFYRTALDDEWRQTERTFRFGKAGPRLFSYRIFDEVESLGPDDLTVLPYSSNIAT